MTKLNASGSALVYSTYLGGSGADHASDVEVDTGGTAYVSGKTSSTNFPTVSPLQAANGGSDDAFVTKVNASGSALVYSTYLGGSSADKTLDIAVDSGGSAYVAGPTSSTNFPTASPFQPANAGGDDGFLSKLNASGSALVYSTYLGGNSNDYAYELAVDAGGNVYVAGGTNSANFPMANPYQTANAGDFDVFVTKFSATPTAVALRSFVARRRGSVVLLRWRTGSESDLLGFNVYRGRIRLNRALIPSGSGAGHSYSHLDRAAPRAVPLGYRLQSVARDGSRSWIGDASVPKSRRP